LFRYLLGRDDTPRLVDLLLHLPASVIDRRARPKIRDAVPGTVVTLEVTVDRHRPTPGRNPRAPHLVYASDDTGDVVLTYFRSPTRLCRKTAAGRRQTLRLRHRPDVRRHPADHASRPRRGRGGFRKTVGHRSGLSAYRRVGAGFVAARDGAGAAKAPGFAGMDQSGSDPPLQVSEGRGSPEPRARAGRVDGHSARWPVLVASLPSTNCWPVNWRWRWCARSCAALPAIATPATAICARRSSMRCPIR